MRLKMAEEKKIKRRGLGGKGRKEADPEPTAIAEESQTVVTTKPLSKKSKPPIVLIILVAVISFGAVGAVVWKILHDNQEKFAKVATQSLELRESVAQITKGISEAKSLAALDSLNVKATDAIKGLETLKDTAKSIGDEETSKNIDLDLAKIKPIPARLKNLIDRESKTRSAIDDIEKSVQPLKNVEKLNCDQLFEAPKKFDEAIAKLSNQKNVPVESLANADARKLVTEYISLKQKNANLYQKNCKSIPLPPPEQPQQSYVPEQPQRSYIPEQPQQPYIPEQPQQPIRPEPTPLPGDDGVKICPPGSSRATC